ncbi:uncharacterized protein CDV56_109101 [Aspergillus thermomutatus]|uniref:Uncharacterized protein n=1 Tax=Aspergillus thermomutatus TaxID=41047 RepID=A0A397I1I0_ASPTH|nr:uncharacterized protein CDV56_109101 [Aspergillus thermomutatus]RHZ67163.1 hypothetical protein CDV56_109101 [Aspergillus thermomutatus]
MIAPNEADGASLASSSNSRRRKPPKLRRERPQQHGLDEAAEKAPNGDMESTEKQAFVPKTSEDASNVDGTSEGESAATEPQLHPVLQQRQTRRLNKPFHDDEEGEVAEHDDFFSTAGRQRPRRVRRGEQQLVPLNTIDNVGRTVGQSGALVPNRTEGAVGRITDTSGRVLGRTSEQNEPQKKEKDEQLRLRLELNLDLEVELKAKISGDLTLSLLLVTATAHCDLEVT